MQRTCLQASLCGNSLLSTEHARARLKAPHLRLAGAALANELCVLPLADTALQQLVQAAQRPPNPSQRCCRAVLGVWAPQYAVPVQATLLDVSKHAAIKGCHRRL